MPDTDLSKLKSQLLTSGIQKDNNALHQVIWSLIDFVRRALLALTQSIITVNNDSSTLPNSRQLVAGSGITITNDGRRLIISSAAQTPPGIDGTTVYEYNSPTVATTVITGVP